MGTIQIDGSTPKLTIGNATAEDATILFDGNAQDFYIALDDSADDLLIGLGSTVGTTPAIAIDENLKVNIPVTTASTSASTGSLTTGGGAGIGADLYVGDDVYLITDSAILGFGADKDTTLTHTDGTGLTLNSTNKICFNDASQFIQGSSNAILALGATDEIDLTATAIDINGTADVSGAFTTGSTIVSTGAITSNAGVVVDGVTIDGAEFDFSTGDYTFDIAGSINLDSSDGAINIRDTGTDVLRIAEVGTTVIIKSVVSDDDLVLQGNDGGSQIDALTFDMSDKGAMILGAHGNINFPDTQNASSDANTLDDYQEGSWTVATTIETGSASLESGYDLAQFVKIGRMVHIQGNVRIDAISSNDGYFQLSLPFTADNNSAGETSGNSAITCSFYAASSAAINAFVTFVLPNEAKLAIYEWDGDSEAELGDRLHADTRILFGGTYLATG